MDVSFTDFTLHCTVRVIWYCMDNIGYSLIGHRSRCFDVRISNCSKYAVSGKSEMPCFYLLIKVTLLLQLQKMPRRGYGT
jgi:hypothetical protein